MNLQLRIWLFNLALSIYAYDIRSDVRMLAHAHVGYKNAQYGFVWFQAEQKPVRAVFGRTFRWLYPRKVLPPTAVAPRQIIRGKRR